MAPNEGIPTRRSQRKLVQIPWGKKSGKKERKTRQHRVAERFALGYPPVSTSFPRPSTLYNIDTGKKGQSLPLISH